MKVIGIRKEDKNRWERRVSILPRQVKELKEKYGIETQVQSSPNRVFTDEEYRESGAIIVPHVPDTKVLFAVKEIPIEYYKKGHCYVFFAHVIKGQDYNMPMLRRMMELNCTLIDYEKITDEKGRRLVFFGREAGQAGMIDTLWALGKRLDYEGISTSLSEVKKTVDYYDLGDAKAHLKDVGEHIARDGLPDELCPLIVGFTGYGNVSRGAQEVLEVLPNEEINPGDVEHLKEKGEYSNNVLYKVVFKEEHMVELREGKPEDFQLQDYYDHPEKYRGVFGKYVPHLTVLMNCIYWDEQYPRLVTKAQVKEIYLSREHPTFRVVGDISCDYEGSIEATMHATEPDHPTFVYDPFGDTIMERGQGRGLTIMAVDNLPAELPRESSIRFSESLYPFLASVAGADYSVPFDELELAPEMKRAVILYQGELTPDYEYIKRYLISDQGGKRMKKIVVFGAGSVAAPLVEYLLRQPDFQVTVASRTVSKAEKMVGNAPNGKAMAFTIDQEEKLEELIREHDLAVSLLPYTHHVKVARSCLTHKKHMVTTSYVSDAMKSLDEEAKKAGVILLNECGLDPGIDHMSAMRIIHEVQAKGGRIASFTSFCGGLPAPEANTNPFGYKFSWSPRGVLLAGKNPAQYKMDGEEMHIGSKDLFTSYKMRNIESLGEFEAYPNRNSLPYKEVYGIEDTDTILRGTLRYPGWCRTMKAIVDLGYLSEEPRPELAGKTYKDLTAHLVGAEIGDDIRRKAADYLGLDRTAHQLDRLEWLGLFSPTPLPPGPDNSLDQLCSLMESKMRYEKNERDMIILQHNFIAEYDDRKEHIVSTLIDYGIPGGHTSMARTVGLPAAIATKMIIHREISEPGVHIPIKPGIYNPILDELEKEGIGFEEKTEPA